MTKKIYKINVALQLCPLKWVIFEFKKREKKKEKERGVRAFSNFGQRSNYGSWKERMSSLYYGNTLPGKLSSPRMDKWPGKVAVKPTL